MIEPMVYHGEFWIPNDSSGEPNVKNVGTLQIIEGEQSVLAIHKFKFDGYLFDFSPIEVIWGLIADDFPVTLFGVRFQQSKGTSFISFTVRLVLFGRHVLSLETPAFNKCTVKFPYLKTWVCSSRIQLESTPSIDRLIIDTTNLSSPIVTAEIEKGMQIEIREGVQKKHLPPSFYWEISQEARCVFQSDDEKSLNYFQQLITEFNQFLSIALYCKQFPQEVILSDEKDKKAELVFPQRESKDPRQNQLIQFSELQAKVPLMLINWHKQFSQIAPICRYLLQSLNSNSFDFPDFLIVAQALDGYCKRFVNKNSRGKRPSYKEQIEALLETFKDVSVIRKLNIDSEVLRQSRNKYSHLIPDDDMDITQAVSGQELYNLTKKCKVLLTCCILDLLGLDTDEINLCCEKSHLSATIPS